MSGHLPANRADAPPATAQQRVKLLQGAAGIYIFFILYGKLQERIFTYRSPTGEAFTAVWLLQLVDALASVAVGAVGRLGGTTPGLPQRYLLCAGIGQVMSKYCLSASLAAGLSFPVATLAKSAKMVPVMLGSLAFGGQRFSIRQLWQAAAIVGGTSLVTVSEGGGNSRRGSSSRGLAFVALALGWDGVVAGVQKRLKARCKDENKEERPYDLMFWSNLYMSMAACLAAMAKRELSKGWSFCRKNPTIIGDIAKFAVCGAVGQACIFFTVANFDSVTCTAITTTRKLMSVLLSLAEGDKAQLSALGWTGVTLAAAGLLSEARGGH